MARLEWFYHLFIPRSSNNHRARLLHHFPLFVILGIFVFTQILLNLVTQISPSVLGYASSITPEQVIQMTNQRRAENGLAPLTVNGSLNQVAQLKAGDMFAFNYWAHVSPSGRSPWYFFGQVGYRYIYAGENLARDFMDSGAVVDAWMNSPSHRDNILNPNYKEIGLAVINGTLNGGETTLVVQVFGTPTPSQSKSVTTKISPSVPTLTPTVIPVVSRIEPAAAATVGQSSPESGIGQTAGGGLQIAQTTNQPPAKVTRPAPANPNTFVSSPFSVTKALALFIMGLILVTLFVDMVLVYKRKTVRLSGQSLAHLVFVGILLLTALLTQPGAIK